MIIIGINWEQNSSASLFINGKIIGAVSQERFSRVKNDERYPKDAIDYLLKKNNLKKNQVNKIVFVSKDWGPAWILCRHYSTFSVNDYLKEQNRIWWPKIYENKPTFPLKVFSNKIDLAQFPGRVFWKKIINYYDGKMAHPSEKEFSLLGRSIRKDVVHRHFKFNVPVKFSDHSDSHTAYAYFSQENRKDKFLSLSIDAFGDGINYSAKIFYKSDNKIISKKVVNGDDLIIGRLYRYITLILGLKPNEHEYKVMGLAPYCKEKYYKPLLAKLKKIQDVEGLHFIYKNKPKDHYFFIRELLIGQRFDTIAGALQAYTEYLISKWVKNLVDHTNIKNICIAGGIAMNVKTNMKISSLKKVEIFHVPLSPDDTSQSIGCVYNYLHTLKKNYFIGPMITPYLGRQIEFNKLKKNKIKSIITNFLKKNGFTNKYKLFFDDTINKTAMLLSRNYVIGIVQGKEEFGARALGNRSILANPKNVSIKFKINEKIKDRDFWMPFAASIPEEFHHLYLKTNGKIDSFRYMTNTCNSTLLGKQNIPAALHPYDHTCRPQIIKKGNNILYENLIYKFGEITGVYALLNTSLNLHGSPICSDLFDTLYVLIKSDLDGLLLEDMLLVKKEIHI